MLCIKYAVKVGMDGAGMPLHLQSVYRQMHGIQGIGI